MSLRSPRWATTYTLCFMIFMLISLVQTVIGLEPPHDESVRRRTILPPPQSLTPAPPSTSNASSLLCTAFGECQPCPPEAMNEPFCRPFGNRRLMHCINTTFIPAHPPDSDSAPGQLTTLHPESETPAWESCGRIVGKERADFYEFVACNVVFALIALTVLFFRSKRMQLDQARQLAARIGLIRGDVRRVIRP